MNRQSNKSNGIIVGVLILVFAGLFLAGLLHKLDLNSALGNFWPVIVMLLGIFVMSSDTNELVGFGIGIFGFILLLHTLGFFDTPTGQGVKTALLLLLGLAILVISVSRPKRL